MCPSFRPCIHLAIRPSVCLGVFFGIISLVYSKFWHGARNRFEVVRDRDGFSRKKIFAPKIRKMGKNGLKTRFLNLLKNFVIIFYWICSIMKIYIICYAPAQIPYLGKFLFLRYEPKFSPPIRLQDFLINHISTRNQWNSLIFYMLTHIHIN